MFRIFDNLLKIFFFGIGLILLGFIIAFSDHNILTYGIIIAGLGLFIVVLSLLYAFIYVKCIEPYYNNKEKRVNVNYNEDFNTDLILNKTTIEDETCSICLKNDNQVFKLKCCNYYAHHNCVKEWYNLNPTKNECFICKSTIETI